MNKQEKELAKLDLAAERALIAEMRGHYETALGRVNERIERLSERDDLSGIRQRDFQTSLAEQIGQCLDELRSESHATLESFLEESYERGFVGTLYNLQKQGVPLAFPIDHNAAAKAVQMSADGVKLSKRLYGNVGKLQKQVVAEVTRGFADASHVGKIAENIAYETDIAGEIKRNVKGRADQALRRAMTIARTEKGRVMSESQMEAMRKAKKAGADVVKQWDSTLDGRTRKSHRKLNGQIRELDEPFEVGGHKAQAPHKFGRPEEDINCRCTVNQRSRTVLEMPEGLEYTKWDGDNQCYVDLSSAENYAEFKGMLKGLEKGAERTQIDASAKVYQTLEQKHIDAIASHVAQAQAPARAVYLAFENRIKLIDGKSEGGACFSPLYGGVKMNIEKTFNDEKQPRMNTWFHEFGHNIDYLANGEESPLEKIRAKKSMFASVAYDNNAFGKSLRDEVKSIIETRNKELREQFKQAAKDLDTKWFFENGYFLAEPTKETLEYHLSSGSLKHMKLFAYSSIEKELRSIPDAARCDISDIFEGATNAAVQAGWGHGKSYWKPRKGAELEDNLSVEAFAEMFSAMTSNPESLKTLKKYLPKSVDIFGKILEAIQKGEI